MLDHPADFSNIREYIAALLRKRIQPREIEASLIERFTGWVRHLIGLEQRALEELEADLPLRKRGEDE